MKKTEHIIDAAHTSIGRVASQAAKALMGKMSASYEPRVDAPVQVSIRNASKLLISEKKRLQKTYARYSGYPGGLRVESLSNLSARKGNGAVLRLAIQRMLPNNTMRVSRMKRITITD